MEADFPRPDLFRHCRRLALAGLLAWAGAALAAGVAVNSIRNPGGAAQPPARQGFARSPWLPDGAVSGSITVSGMTPPSPHSRRGERPERPGHRQARQDRRRFAAVPAGTRLNEAQLARFNAGATYINVHSEAFPPGKSAAS